MKKLGRWGIVLIATLLGTGCISTMGPVGLIYTDIVSPQAMGHETVYMISPASDFESVAFVEGEAKGMVILGLVALGDFGYGAAIEDALKKAPGATRLIDITADTKLKSILGVFQEYTTRVRGRAVKLRKK